MSRDRTARTRIRQYLANNGPLVEQSGYATGALKDAIAYTGTSVAFIQLIAAMERDGEIVRDIRGKRTYKISATPSTIEEYADSGVDDNTSVGGVEIDYNKLARAIVREFWLAATTSAPPVAEPVAESREDYARRLDTARAQIGEPLSEAAQVAGESQASR